MQGFNWDDLRILLAVARQKSFGAAAAVLKIDQTTTARRVRRAERQLASKLFERQGGRLLPTKAGTILVEHAERAEREVHAAVAAATGTDSMVAGEVRITSVPWIINSLLAPSLPSLLSHHQQL